MDYSQYKKIDFRRKFWKFFGVDITVYDALTDNVIAFINQKTIQLKPDVYIYTDTTMQHSIVHLKKKTLMSTKPRYSIIDSQTEGEIGSLQFNDFGSFLVRWHINVFNSNGNQFGYIQETSGPLAILRRWIAMVNDLLALALAFVPQTFDIYYAPEDANPQLVGRIVHRKNPFLVKMSLDLTDAQVTIDPKMNLAICTLLCLRDINKNA